MTEFIAGVQYDDYRGTVAADKSDTEGFRQHLLDKGLATEEEYVAGYRVTMGENHGDEITIIGVVVYLHRGDELKRFRAIEIEMKIAVFLKFFKRFSMVLMKSSLDFSGVQVNGPHYD
ncbi:hypothetical protein [Microbulbifer sp. S227A]|uniref:hypothetical protein n=1 Tax=Microbulbifer sp. S227A TaxID=3415131 RepID=UPI003C7AA732